MRRFLICVLVLSVAVVFPPTASADIAPVCDGAWHVEPGPQDGQTLAAVSSRWIQGAWAVGSTFDPIVGARRTYVQHWNGVDWKRYASPNVDVRATPGDNELLGVVGIGADIWAVGWYADPGDAMHPSRRFPLVMHYGGSTWEVVPTDPSTGPGTLYDVWQVSPSDVWTVGASRGGRHPIVEHWDGLSWQDVPVADPSPSDDVLRSVAGRAADDLWAVGTAAGGTQALAEHWNGSAWSRVATADPENHQALADVSVRRDGLAFAVGETGPDGAGVVRPVIERFRGVWSPSPSPVTSDAVLLGVDRGPHALQRFWAVGRVADVAGSHPLIVHLARGSWRVQRVPDPFPSGTAALADVAVFGRATMDAVGAVAVGNGWDPATGETDALIMRRCAPPV